MNDAMSQAASAQPFDNLDSASLFGHNRLLTSTKKRAKRLRERDRERGNRFDGVAEEDSEISLSIKNADNESI